jgi:DNA replicative helicase MCM subunit Mcm2 (Cdc46/Mcm family)
MNADSYTVSLLEEAAELIESYVDVRDGEDGRPLPNRAMLAAGRLEEAIARLKTSSSGPERQSAEIKFCPACDKEWTE